MMKFVIRGGFSESDSDDSSMPSEFEEEEKHEFLNAGESIAPGGAGPTSSFSTIKIESGPQSPRLRARAKLLTNTMKKSLSSYHDSMFGFFGVVMEPQSCDSEGDIHESDHQNNHNSSQKEKEKAIIKEKARVRMLRETEQVRIFRYMGSVGCFCSFTLNNATV
jgi:hypothetical protein